MDAQIPGYKQYTGCSVKAYCNASKQCGLDLKPVRIPVAILGSLGVCICVPASRHWLVSYCPIHLT